MRRINISLIFLIIYSFLFLSFSLAQEKPPLSKKVSKKSSRSSVSSVNAQQMDGWRGNWTGKFPNANPPVKWGKASKLMSGLYCQAKKPEGNKPSGTPLYHGAITEWLVLGPLTSKGGDEALNEEFVSNESTWQPDEGEKVKGKAWKKVKTQGSVLQLATIFAKDCRDSESVPFLPVPFYKSPYVGYVHAYIYSKQEGTVDFRSHIHRKAKVYVNGVLVNVSKRKVTVELKRGWNRMLCKVANNVIKNTPKNKWTIKYEYKPPCQYCKNTWFMDAFMVAAGPYDTEMKNIAWATRLPNWSASGPIIVGDRIFVMAEPGDLVCVNKEDGKVLWVRSITFYNTVDKEEKKTNSAFREVNTVVKKLEDMNDDYTKQADITESVLKERAGLHGKIGNLMKKIDPKKYFGLSAHGFCMPTPISDGRYVYTWMGNGIAACFDLNGNQQWATSVCTTGKKEHGFASSPILAEGKLVVFRLDVYGLDPKTGKIIWQTDIRKGERGKFFNKIHTSLTHFKIGRDSFFYVYDTILRVSDGSIAWQKGRNNYRGIPTPIIENGYMYMVSGNLLKWRLPESPGNISLVNEGKVSTSGGVSSLLYHKGLIYVVGTTGVLSVIDDRTQSIVYRKDMGFGERRRTFLHERGSIYASPVLAGKHIYIFGVDGTTIVIKPGRKYEEVARNKIEDISKGRYISFPEGFSGTPVAEGKYLYVRGDKYLYCIGEK